MFVFRLAYGYTIYKPDALFQHHLRFMDRRWQQLWHSVDPIRMSDGHNNDSLRTNEAKNGS